MPDLRLINDYDYRIVLKRRRFTLRRELRQRINADEIIDHDDVTLKKLRLLSRIAELNEFDIGE